MRKVALSLVLSMIVGVMIFGFIGSVNAAEADVLGCKRLYWIDNENKSCGQSEFCGAYMYQGLQTFESETQCLKEVNKDCICTMDAKACPDGSYVGRVCPDCEFAECKNQYFNLSNGRKAEIKIMPETASERAIERLGELNFTVELKEVGSGNESKVVYEMEGEKQGRFLGIIKTTGKLKIQVDAETGEIISVKKPWWAFLATRI
jgi:hypothetical protein